MKSSLFVFTVFLVISLLYPFSGIEIRAETASPCAAFAGCWEMEYTLDAYDGGSLGIKERHVYDISTHAIHTVRLYDNSLKVMRLYHHFDPPCCMQTAEGEWSLIFRDFGHLYKAMRLSQETLYFTSQDMEELPARRCSMELDMVFFKVPASKALLEGEWRFEGEPFLFIDLERHEARFLSGKGAWRFGRTIEELSIVRALYSAPDTRPVVDLRIGKRRGTDPVLIRLVPAPDHPYNWQMELTQVLDMFTLSGTLTR